MMFASKVVSYLILSVSGYGDFFEYMSVNFRKPLINIRKLFRKIFVRVNQALGRCVG